LIPLEARNKKQGILNSLSIDYLSLTLLQRTKLITNLIGISTTQLLGRQRLSTTKIALLTQLKTPEKLGNFSKRQPISIPLTPPSLKSLHKVSLPQTIPKSLTLSITVFHCRNQYTNSTVYHQQA
jgi:hypothetical protein